MSPSRLSGSLRPDTSSMYGLSVSVTIFSPRRRALPNDMSVFRCESALPICKLAMLPIMLHHESAIFVGRDIVWLADGTAAFGCVIKRASLLAINELLIASCWMKARAFEFKHWLEYADSGGNSLDGVSREFGSDQDSRDHGFAIRPLEQFLFWYMTGIRAAWTAALKPQGVVR